MVYKAATLKAPPTSSFTNPASKHTQMTDSSPDTQLANDIDMPSDSTYSPWRFSVAPMLDWTDRHDRYFLRLISKHARLYTEMVTTGALIHGGDDQRFLGFNPEEEPLALQLGGSVPADLARCAKTAENWGYNEVNLNVGCPSDRVQSGSFGACLMAEPQLVADGIKAMQDAVSTIPITVKCRIGIDDMDEESGLREFVRTVANAGCEVFTIHARKAWLKGLSPKENRDIPPLNYDLVYQIKKENPNLTIAINGGIKTLAECHEHLQHLDGVMVGREAYQNPYLLATVDQELYGEQYPVVSRSEIFHALLPYVESELSKGGQLSYISRHILGLFHGMPGARLFRRHLSENAYKKGADIKVLTDAYDLIVQHCPDI
jgi:tRNA-dihydrouridine synthase A